MPLYPFSCDNCGNEITKLMSVAELEKLENDSTIYCECGHSMKRTLTKANYTTHPGRGFFGSKPKV